VKVLIPSGRKVRFLSWGDFSLLPVRARPQATKPVRFGGHRSPGSWGENQPSCHESWHRDIQPDEFTRPGGGDLHLHDWITGIRIGARLNDGGIRNGRPSLQISGGLHVDRDSGLRGVLTITGRPLIVQGMTSGPLPVAENPAIVSCPLKVVVTNWIFVNCACATAGNAASNTKVKPASQRRTPMASIPWDRIVDLGCLK
jgi:hypothetical protein